MKTRVPPLTSLEMAVRLYYEKLELGNAELKQLFGEKHSPATFCRLKNAAREVMQKENIGTYSIHRVNTKAAYVAWGLDIADLEARYLKLKRMAMLAPATVLRGAE